MMAALRQFSEKWFLLAALLFIICTCCEDRSTAIIYDHYSRADPGDGPPRIPVISFSFDNDTDGWHLAERANDGRIHTEGSIAWSPDPFGNGNGKLMIICNFNGVPDEADADRNRGVSNTMDGIPLQVPFPAPLAITEQTFIEFDLYYPMDSNGKLMRIELWSSSSGGMGNFSSGYNRTQLYVRPDSLEYLNGKVAGEYNGQVYRVKKLSGRSPVSEGFWSDLRFDIHAENATAWDNGILFIDNVSILQQQEGEAIPLVINRESGTDLPSIKDYYADKFLVGTVSRGLDNLALRHFNIVTPGGSLKAENVHPNPPQWLLDATAYPLRNSNYGIALKPEYSLDYQGIEFSRVKEMGYLAHGHVLAWYTQASRWMRQIIPETIKSAAWNADGRYYAAGNNAAPPFFPVNRELVRRMYYNHIIRELRYFSSTDPRYGGREILSFLSFDVLNEEIHETRHIDLVAANQHEWKSALRNTSWLMAMTDDDYDDIRQHFVYLLFKYAHIAVPNAQMAARYKEHYASLPAYMKADDHDNGPEKGIDAFICDTPSILFYNDFDLYQFSKARVAYNMVRELNLLWQDDPLYDGRLLIEGIGIQGHDAVSPTLAADNARAIALFAALVDEGLLNSIAISELDLVQPDSAPGGAASSSNGDILNQKQADTIAYQFALLFNVYLQYSNYIDRVTFWGSRDPGWGGSYKVFDQDGMAAPAYYAVMDPDRFISGHSYLDDYFSGKQ